MAPWLALAASCSLALLMASYPVLWRKSPEGKHLWRRSVRTQREDLRLGAASLLVAAVLLAFLGTVTYDGTDPPSAGATGQKITDSDPAWNHAAACAACLMAVAVAALVRSCAASSNRRFITYN
jgi:hypothetical protein